MTDLLSDGLEAIADIIKSLRRRPAPLPKELRDAPEPLPHAEISSAEVVGARQREVERRQSEESRSDD